MAETLTSLDCLAVGYLALDADAAATTRLTQTRHEETSTIGWVDGSGHTPELLKGLQTQGILYRLF
jgi:hypothetical protein